MSVMRSTQSGVNNRLVVKSKSSTFTIALLLSIIMLSILDLLLASIRNDTLSNFTMYVIADLLLSLVALIFSFDLMAKGRESISCFLAYTLFLWACMTILKSVFQL